MMKLGKLITVHDATRLHSVSFQKLGLQMDFPLLILFSSKFYEISLSENYKGGVEMMELGLHNISFHDSQFQLELLLLIL